MWLGLFIPDWQRVQQWDRQPYWQTECFALPAMLQFSDPFQLTWGSNAIGTLQVVERREIVPSFRDMIGLTPRYQSVVLFSVLSGWTSQLPLTNDSVAQVTLEWDRLDEQRPGFSRLYPVIVDNRERTFLAAVSSIGGLLAALQGLHVLLFGRPLWWGIFGIQLIDPFGIFGTAFSRGAEERMVSRYGYIPHSPTDDSTGAHSLGLFLSEFVMEVGPLRRRRTSNNDFLDEGEGEIPGRSSERDSPRLPDVQLSGHDEPLIQRQPSSVG